MCAFAALPGHFSRRYRLSGSQQRCTPASRARRPPARACRLGDRTGYARAAISESSPANVTSCPVRPRLCCEPPRLASSLDTCRRTAARQHAGAWRRASCARTAPAAAPDSLVGGVVGTRSGHPHTPLESLYRQDHAKRKPARFFGSRVRARQWTETVPRSRGGGAVVRLTATLVNVLACSRRSGRCIPCVVCFFRLGTCVDARCWLR